MGTHFSHRKQGTPPKGSKRLLNPRCRGTHFSHRMLGTVIKGSKRLFIFRAQHEDAVLSPYAGDAAKGQPATVKPSL